MQTRSENNIFNSRQHLQKLSIIGKTKIAIPPPDEPYKWQVKDIEQLFFDRLTEVDLAAIGKLMRTKNKEKIILKCTELISKPGLYGPHHGGSASVCGYRENVMDRIYFGGCEAAFKYMFLSHKYYQVRTDKIIERKKKSQALPEISLNKIGS